MRYQAATDNKKINKYVERFTVEAQYSNQDTSLVESWFGCVSLISKDRHVQLSINVTEKAENVLQT